MAQDGHNLVLFGQPGPQLTRVVQTLKGLGGRLRLAPTWSALDFRLGEGGMDCVVLCLTGEQENDAAFVRDAFDRVTAVGVPTVVTLARPLALDREASPAVALFDVVVGSPLDPIVLTEAIDLAIALARGLDTTPSNPAVSSADSASHDTDIAGEAEDELSDSMLDVRSWGRPPSATDDGSGARDSGAHVLTGGAAHSAAPARSQLARPDGRPGSPPSDSAEKISTRRWGHDTISRETASVSAAARLDEDEPGGPPHISALPPLEGGDLAQMAPYRVLLAHAIGHSTGRLELENGGIVREVVLLDGEPGTLDVMLGERDRRKVHLALLWEAGHYRFESEPIERVRFRSLGSVLELVHAALYEGLTLNQASDRLSQHFKSYVVPTERTRTQRDMLAKLPGLIALLESLADRPVEQIVGSAGGNFEAVLKNLVFCTAMDLVTFSETPESGPVPVRFTAQSVVARVSPPPPVAPTPSAADAPRVPAPRASPSAPPATEPAQPLPAKPPRRERPLPPPVGATESDDEEEDEAAAKVIEDLAELVEEWRGKDSYQVFGLEVGCGRQALRDRYYELVRVHHPDTYGLARSPGVKPLAEMVFRVVQKAYNDLRRVETGETDALLLPSPEAAVDERSSPGSKKDDPSAGSRADDRSSPGARVASDHSSPGSEVASDRSSPGSGVAGDRSSPGSRVASDRSTPGSGVAADRSAPGSRVAADRSSPGSRVAADRSRPGTRSGRDHSSPGRRVASDASSPGARGTVAGPTREMHERSRPGSRVPIATPSEVAGAVPDAGSQPGSSSSGRGTQPGSAKTPAGSPVDETPVPRSGRAAEGPVRRDPQLDSTARLRALRGLSGEFASMRTPGSLAAVATGPLPPEQHYRNGLHMLKAGAFDRAVWELEAAAEGRTSSTLYRAHLAWARYQLDPSTAEDQKRALRELIEDATAQEHACVFLGHLLAAEGDAAGALNYYRLCLTVNPRNIEALRRVRLHRMRTDNKKEGLFDRLFSKKTTKKSR